MVWRFLQLFSLIDDAGVLCARLQYSLTSRRGVYVRIGVTQPCSSGITAVSERRTGVISLRFNRWSRDRPSVARYGKLNVRYKERGRM